MTSVPDVCAGAQPAGRSEPVDGTMDASTYSWLLQPSATITFDEWLTLLRRPADATEKRLLPVHAVVSTVDPQRACLLCDPRRAAGDASATICGKHPTWVAEQLATRGMHPVLEQTS